MAVGPRTKQFFKLCWVQFVIIQWVQMAPYHRQGLWPPLTANII